VVALSSGDAWLTAGSSNLNKTRFFNDPAMNVLTDGPTVAREIRLRLWAEHLSCRSSRSGDPARVVDAL
jgi:phosphatidylserine/phosphatidylglycerophosphate/cardiolipin synthase-like enzyme